MNPTIVTHTCLDWDAIGSSWLLARFEPTLAQARFAFVPANQETCETVLDATAVVDVGRQLDPARLRFDHHQDNLGKTTCAMRQVHEYLINKTSDEDTSLKLRAIAPLVNLVYKADTGHTDAATEESYTLGIHALLSAEKGRLRDSAPPPQWDALALEFGFSILDRLLRVLESRLRAQSRPRGEVVYRSPDNRVCAIRNGNPAELFDEGAVLVVYESEPIVVSTGENTYPVGVSRAFGFEVPHVGNLIEGILLERRDLDEVVRSEVASWWRHPSGFMAGRGSPRAPRNAPVTIDIALFAKILDEAWDR